MNLAPRGAKLWVAVGVTYGKRQEEHINPAGVDRPLWPTAPHLTTAYTTPPGSVFVCDPCFRRLHPRLFMVSRSAGLRLTLFREEIQIGDRYL